MVACPRKYGNAETAFSYNDLPAGLCACIGLGRPGCCSDFRLGTPSLPSGLFAGHLPKLRTLLDILLERLCHTQLLGFRA